MWCHNNTLASIHTVQTGTEERLELKVHLTEVLTKICEDMPFSEVAATAPLLTQDAIWTLGMSYLDSWHRLVS